MIRENDTMTNILNAPFNVGDFVRYINYDKHVKVAYIDQIIIKFETSDDELVAYSSTDEILTQIHPLSTYGREKERIHYNMLLEGEERYFLGTNDTYKELNFISIEYVLVCADTEHNQVVLASENRLYPLSNFVHTLAKGSHEEMKKMGTYLLPEMLKSFLSYITPLEIKECKEEAQQEEIVIEELLMDTFKGCVEKTKTCIPTGYSNDNYVNFSVELDETRTATLFFTTKLSGQGLVEMHIKKSVSDESEDTEDIGSYRLFNCDRNELLQVAQRLIGELLVKAFNPKKLICSLEYADETVYYK